MKRFVLSILIFCCISLVGLVLLLGVSGKYLPQNWRPNLVLMGDSSSHMYKRMHEIKGFGKVDVLFVGSSHTYRSFDPRIFQDSGIRIFNAGSSAQTPLQSEYILNRYLDSINPKVVVIELYRKMIADDGVESSLDFLGNDGVNASSLRMALNHTNPKVYLAFLYGSVFPIASSKAVNANENYVSGGYVESINKPLNSLQSFSEISWQSQELQLQAIQRMVNLLKKKGISMELILTPMTRPYYQAQTGGEVFDFQMKQLGNFTDFNQQGIGFSDTSDFYDREHFNNAGATKFSKYFAHWLLEKYPSLKK